MTFNTTSTISLTNARKLLPVFHRHAINQGFRTSVDVDSNDLPCVLYGQSESHGFNVEATASRLKFNLWAPDSSALYWFRESITLQLAAVNEKMAEAIRWSDGFDTDEHRHPPNFSVAWVVSTHHLSLGFVRLVLHTDNVERFCNGGIHAKLMLPIVRGRKPQWPTVQENGTTAWSRGDDAMHVRYFTVRSVDLVRNSLTVDILSHDQGVFGRFAKTAAPGQRLGIMGPAGGSEPPIEKAMILTGDRTAMPAIARICANVESDFTGKLIVAGNTINESQTYFDNTKFNLQCLSTDSFDTELITVLEQTPHPARAWFAGEGQTSKAVRKVFENNYQLSRSQYHAGMYWRAGQQIDARF